MDKIHTPALSNGHVRLRALDIADLDWLRAAETDELLAFRWRLRGGHPSPNDFVDQLWHGLLVMFVVEKVDDSASVGILSAYQADQRNGHCRVAGARLSLDGSMDSSFLAGLALFLDYLFGGWPFRKVYLETPEFNLPQFASAVRGYAVVNTTYGAGVFATQYRGGQARWGTANLVTNRFYPASQGWYDLGSS